MEATIVMTETTPLLYRALLAIDSACDGAHAEDGRGFNGRDTGFGKDVAAKLRQYGRLTERQEAAVLRMLRTYQGQLLRDYGIEYDAIVQEHRERTTTPRENVVDDAMTQAAARVGRRIERAPGGFRVVFSYDKAVVAKVQDIRPHTHRRFINDVNGKHWFVAEGEDSTNVLLALIADDGFVADDATRAALDVTNARLARAREMQERRDQTIRETLERQRKRNENRYAFSSCHDGTLEEILKVPLPAKAQTDLFPYQRDGVVNAVRRKKCLIADSPGLGKTRQALYWYAVLRDRSATLHRERVQRMVIFTTKSGKGTWPAEIDLILPDLNYRILNGGNVSDIDGSVECILLNYDIAAKWADAIIAWGPQAMVLDEVHKIKERKTKRTRAITRIRQHGGGMEYVLALSGTPMVNRPIELVEPLRMMDALPDFGGESHFRRYYCDGHLVSVGRRTFFDASGATNLLALNQRLRETVMVRRTKDMVLPDLPPIIRTTIPHDLANREEYDDCRLDLIRYIKDHYGDDAANAAAKAEVLVRMARLRELAGLGKVEPVAEWVDDFIEDSDEKLILFAWHKAVQAALVERLAPYNPLTLMANDSAVKRKANEVTFQTDPERRLIICSIQAASEAITLTAATHVGFVELGWTPGGMDQAEGRCYGRVNDAHGANGWYHLAARTIDLDMADLLNLKRQVIELATDGNTSEQEIRVAVLERMLNDEDAH